MNPFANLPFVPQVLVWCHWGHCFTCVIHSKGWTLAAFVWL